MLDAYNVHAVRGDAKIVADYLDDNPNQLDNRTIFQSTLLHIAARNGRLQVAVELLRRGIDVNALDYVSYLSVPCKGLTVLYHSLCLCSCNIPFHISPGLHIRLCMSLPLC